MSDQLAAQFIATVNGRLYRAGPDPSEPGQPLSIEVEFRDNETTRLGLKVWDALGNDPFPEFNAVPNPRLDPNIPVLAWMGWEGDTLVKVFEGLLTAKSVHHQLSETDFTASHLAFNLRKRGKVDAVKGVTVAQLLKKKASEEGLNLILDSSVAGDDALNTPISVALQLGENNWTFMDRYLHELGYITTQREKDVIVVRVDKSSGSVITIKRGDDQLRSLQVREEQRKDGRSTHRKDQLHETKPGEAAHPQQGDDPDGSKNVQRVPPAIPRDDKDHKYTLTKASVKGVSRRLQKEGDELTIELRARFEMKNEEIITLSGFGGQVDGDWHTSSVVHRIGGGVATTQATCWRS